jgi:hypothetical protein
MLFVRYLPIGVLLFAVTVSLACASEPTSAPTATPLPPTVAVPTLPPLPPAATPTPQAAATSTPEHTLIPYDSNRAMYKLFPGFGQTSNRTFDVLEEVRLNNDKSMVPVLVESMRFQSTANAREASAGVLRELTGEQYGGDDWKQWMEWLGKRREDYPPPEQYLDWKINFMSQLNPRFSTFLRPALEGAITVDPTEIVWGGVDPDGIPDIRDPKMLTPDEADFLDEDDRVFGVSINGDTRAYPLRIINAHEMVNDTVGGEPISLAW